MTSDAFAYGFRLSRADEAIAGATAELAAGRLNNAVNRAYYACFHIGVIMRVLSGDQPERIDPRDSHPLWAHGGTMMRLNQILIARDLPRMVPIPIALLTERMRADYYADGPSTGVSLETATASLAQALQLRRTIALMLQ